MSAEENSELDADNVNNSATTSPSTSNMAVNMDTDNPRWENSVVTEVRAW